MKPQSIKRKIKIFLHCLFRFHRRGSYWRRREDELIPHCVWVCATCAEKQVRLNKDLTPREIEWANELIKAHPEWNGS